MKFEELDKKMRIYEQSLDQIILPEMFLVVRLDGRGFTRLTKEICNFEAPFDIKFRDLMVKTVCQLMNSGFRIIYGFCESDEISLLFHPDDNTFGRKVRKINSVLAGAASAVFSLELGIPSVFDCRTVPLPTVSRVVDYFMWRQEDAHRNALNSHCYWMLRKEGQSAAVATAMLEGQSTSFKNELLFSRGINFNELPTWQKRGIGVINAAVEKKGINPISGKEESTLRKELSVLYELPLREEYADFISQLITQHKTDN